MQLQQYARGEIQRLMERVGQEVERTAHDKDADAIHDLRVSIRRLTQALRAFGSLFPKQEAKQVRRQLKQVMNLAGEVRSRDIALELFEAAGVPASAATCVRLALEREDAIQALVALTGAWRGSDYLQQWQRLIERRAS